MECLSENLFLVRDTCHVYVIRSGEEAVLIDFGDGAALDGLAEIGVRRVTDILMTHHHRDQCQGLARALVMDAALRGARVWAPHAEQDLFHSVDAHWQSRALLNNYDVRQDRFSLLDPVPLAGTLKDYAVYRFGGRAWQVIPAPGHTPGSTALLATIDNKRVAFSGDLIAGPGKVWSMAALQWTYHAMEGAPASIASLVDLKERCPERLLPSHGVLMDDPAAAIDALVDGLRALLDARQENMRLMDWIHHPYETITPHLLRNRTSVANSYVLLSESGKALMIDYGYDFITGNILGTEPDRAMHRPWLYTLPALKRDFGVQKIDAVIATHYHDDHVAGLNLLRDVEGTQVWAAESFSEVLEHPARYDLPCLWYDPIPVDRVLRMDQPVIWEEYTFTVYPLPGHTRYAAAVAFEVDGKRVLATGDQYKGNAGVACNYVYQNGFEIEDYQASAEIYARFAPEIILPGHWEPLRTDAAYFQHLREGGDKLAALHRDLLPLDSIDFGAEGFAARIQPYHWVGRGGCAIDYQVEVRNPLPHTANVRAKLILPDGWQAASLGAADASQTIALPAGETAVLAFHVTPPQNLTGRRFRLAADVSAGEVHLGQQAEALVDLIPSS